MEEATAAADVDAVEIAVSEQSWNHVPRVCSVAGAAEGGEEGRKTSLELELDSDCYDSSLRRCPSDYLFRW